MIGRFLLINFAIIDKLDNGKIGIKLIEYEKYTVTNITNII